MGGVGWDEIQGEEFAGVGRDQWGFELRPPHRAKRPKGSDLRNHQNSANFMLGKRNKKSEAKITNDLT